MKRRDEERCRVVSPVPSQGSSKPPQSKRLAGHNILHDGADEAKPGS